MTKIISLALLVGGIVLIVYGIRASDSIGSDFSRMFTGSPTNKSIWLLIAGVLTATIGLGCFRRGSNWS
jgi:hypothetical protein